MTVSTAGAKFLKYTCVCVCVCHMHTYLYATYVCIYTHRRACPPYIHLDDPVSVENSDRHLKFPSRDLPIDSDWAIGIPNIADTEENLEAVAVGFHRCAKIPNKSNLLVHDRGYSPWWQGRHSGRSVRQWSHHICTQEAERAGAGPRLTFSFFFRSHIWVESSVKSV